MSKRHRGSVSENRDKGEEEKYTLPTLIELCKTGDRESTSRLRDMALVHGITNAITMTKRALCETMSRMLTDAPLAMINDQPIPELYLDDVSTLLLDDAFVTNSGHTYNKSTIDNIVMTPQPDGSFAKVDPMTRTPITMSVRNIRVKQIIDAWKSEARPYETTVFTRDDIPTLTPEMYNRQNSSFHQWLLARRRSIFPMVSIVFEMSPEWKVTESYSNYNGNVRIQQSYNGRLVTTIDSSSDIIESIVLGPDEQCEHSVSMFYYSKDFNTHIRYSPDITKIRRQALIAAMDKSYPPVDFKLTFTVTGVMKSHRNFYDAFVEEYRSDIVERPQNTFIGPDVTIDGTRWRHEQVYRSPPRGRRF